MCETDLMPSPYGHPPLARGGRHGNRHIILKPDLNLMPQNRTTLPSRDAVDGCPLACAALAKLSASGVAVFCGVDPDADLTALEGFAQRVFGDEMGHGPALPTEPPLAMVLSPNAEPQRRLEPPARLC